MPAALRIVVLKPSKYSPDGFVERFRWGFMPNSTVPHLRSMTPSAIVDTRIEVEAIDEYVHTDLKYLSLLTQRPGARTLLALVGVQSHQLQRALDLGAYARANGCMVVLGGPHAMTCDTSELHCRGVSFALAEAELVWPLIVSDACSGELRPVYGRDQRWQDELESPVIIPPSREDLRRYVVPMLGLYPARGCPFLCNFCSVIKIAGRRVRNQSIETSMASLRAAKAAGVKLVMFTTDNFNKYTEAEALLNAMIDERLGMQFFVQCDTQIARQEQLVALMARAGCFQMFVGVESFNRQTLMAAHKGQNRPETYKDIIRLCREYGISSHFSNIIGFPQDTESGVREHLATLQELAPAWASFYILTPIPGTEQYDEFMANGWITDRNLDRYDGSHLTWRHPNLSRARVTQMLFACYKEFYTLPHALDNLRRMRRASGRRNAMEAVGSLAISLFNRHCADTRMHPMSGGVRRARLDRVDDFLQLRRKTFGFDLVPLPKSLPLPAEEARLNRYVNLRARPVPRTVNIPSPRLLA